MARGQFIGIDFGTSTTLIAESHPAGSPSVVPIGDSTSWMPSVAAVNRQGLEVAERALAESPVRVIRSVKRYITEGKSRVSTPDGLDEVDVDALIHAILAEVASRARLERLPIGDEGVTRLGCPAMWDAPRRQRLLRLAEGAGFRVGPATLIDEPVAAGLSWIAQSTARREFFDNEQVLVFDMGGGTLDVAVLRVKTDDLMDPEIHVLASEGVNEAGDVLDAAIEAQLADRLSDLGIDIDSLPDRVLARAYLRRAATEAKVDLTEMRDTDVRIEYSAVPLPTLRYSIEELTDAFRPQLERAWQLVEATVRSSFLTREQDLDTSSIRGHSGRELLADIQHVLLAGGMSRIPAVERLLSERIPHARIHSFSGSAGAQEAIVAGLAQHVNYENVNLPLPPFDFVLEYEGSNGTKSEMTLYRAHTKCFTPAQAMSQFRVRYEWPNGPTATDPHAHRSLPRSGRGIIVAKALDGTHVPLRHEGSNIDGLRFCFGASASHFTLSPRGEVTVRDGQGLIQSFRVSGWPALRTGFAPIALPIVEPKLEPMRRPAWDIK